MQVLSRSGSAEVLTSPHRPYGNNKVSLQEIKRIREAGGWVCFPCSFSPNMFWPIFKYFVCVCEAKELDFRNFFNLGCYRIEVYL